MLDILIPLLLAFLGYTFCMREKKIGYGLLLTGLFCMIISLVLLVLTLTTKLTPPQFVTLDSLISLSSLPKSDASSDFDIDAILKKSGAQTSPLNSLGGLDNEGLNSLINASLFYVILQLCMGFGYRLAMLGVRLIRPLKIVHETSTESS